MNSNWEKSLRFFGGLVVGCIEADFFSQIVKYLFFRILLDQLFVQRSFTDPDADVVVLMDPDNWILKDLAPLAEKVSSI